jgi:hypothetical protein
VRGAQGECVTSQKHLSKNSCSNETNTTQTEEDKPPAKSSSLRDKFKLKKQIPDELDAAVNSLYNLWKGFELSIKHTRADKKSLTTLLTGELPFEQALLAENGIDPEKKSFTKEEIQTAITNFATYAQKTPKVKKYTIDQFIYNQFNKKIPSSFLFNLTNNPNKLKKESIDDLPEETLEERMVTDAIKLTYKNEVFHNADVEFSFNDEKNFRKARDFVLQFKKKHRMSINEVSNATLGKYVVLCWVEKLEGETGKIKTSWLCGKAIEQELFQYLDRKGLIRNRHQRAFDYGL